jgi:hypothetical protein
MYKNRWQTTITKVSQRLFDSVKRGSGTATSMVAEGYNNALKWKDNAELSRWLSDHLSHRVSTVAGKTMDAEYRRTHIGGNWHRLYDGGHTLAGSWNAVHEALPDLSALDQLGTWANEYWKDLITTRGMPIITLDHANNLITTLGMPSEYLRHLDSVNVAQLVGGDLVGVSIYCNWNDPAKLVALAASSDCSGIVYGNVIAPLCSLIAFGRAYILVQKSERDKLQDLIAPALKGLTRSGASILLITVIPGGFLLHLSSGIVISLAHGYVWDKGSEFGSPWTPDGAPNKEMILATLRKCLTYVAQTQPFSAATKRQQAEVFAP